jgi:tRNA pseudouridine38-40 synthase
MGTDPPAHLNKQYLTFHPGPLPSRGERIKKDLCAGREIPAAAGNLPSSNRDISAARKDFATSGRDNPPALPDGFRTIRLMLEYDGSGYHGWQRQRNALTIQEVVETCLGRLVGREVRLHGSGRTDAGVHALGQVAHFRTESKLPLPAFREGLNSLLPRDIAILQAEEAPAGFHARFGAKAKTYEYRILNRTVRSPLHLRHCWHLGLALELDRMREATWFIMGEHDFAGFQSSGSAVKTTTRTVLAATWEERPGDWIYFRITAGGFLRGMVRALVGTLVEVGRGKRQPEDMARLLARADRRLAGPAAPAAGLYLVEVVY